MKLIKILIHLAILIGLSLLIAIPKLVVDDLTTKDVLMILTDSISVPSIIFICLAILMFCSNEGAFDMLSYGLLTVLSLFKRNPKDRKYDTYYDYKESRKDKNKVYINMLISGIIYLSIGIIILIIYHLV